MTTLITSTLQDSFTKYQDFIIAVGLENNFIGTGWRKKDQYQKMLEVCDKVQSLRFRDFNLNQENCKVVDLFFKNLVYIDVETCYLNGKLPIAADEVRQYFSNPYPRIILGLEENFKMHEELVAYKRKVIQSACKI